MNVVKYSTRVFQQNISQIEKACSGNGVQMCWLTAALNLMREIATGENKRQKKTM